VVRSHRGLEVAQVLREATPRHAAFLPNTTVGTLLHLLTPEDERTAAAMRARGQELFVRGARLAAETGLPLELLDAEVLLDGQHGVLYHLRWEGCDVRPFVSTLSREFELHIVLTDLTRPPGGAAADEEEEAHGCGREGCGSAGGGGCGTCGFGGCGTCGTASPRDVQGYFAGLRDQMERRRTTLL
jgi:hypothetical protein